MPMKIIIDMSLFTLLVPMAYCAWRYISARFRLPHHNRTQMLNALITARAPCSFWHASCAMWLTMCLQCTAASPWWLQRLAQREVPLQAPRSKQRQLVGVLFVQALSRPGQRERDS